MHIYLEIRAWNFRVSVPDSLASTSTNIHETRHYSKKTGAEEDCTNVKQYIFAWHTTYHKWHRLSNLLVTQEIPNLILLVPRSDSIINQVSVFLLLEALLQEDLVFGFKESLLGLIG